MMRVLAKLAFVVVVAAPAWAAGDDAADREIQKNLDFFLGMELVESGAVLDGLREGVEIDEMDPPDTGKGDEP